MKCTFCNFIKKQKNHEWKKQYPLITIFETKNTYSFLGNPGSTGLSDLLIIPKKHYEFIEDVPKNILSELIELGSFATGILREKYGGANILLNNGRTAEQWVPHVHFHIIPKIPKKVTIFNKHVGKNPWKNLSVEEFIKLSNELKQDFKTLKKVNYLK